MISALLAAGLILATGYWGGAAGVRDLSLLMILVGAWEYSRLAFPSPGCTVFLRWLFLLGSLTYLAVFALSPQDSLLALILILLSYFALSMAFTRNQLSIDEILHLLMKATTGFIYAAVLPTFALGVLSADEGLAWFAMLLLMVFGCDTFAYFGGKAFGRTALMPAISPNKTLEGAISGIGGSLFISLLFWTLYFRDAGLWSHMGLGLTVAIFAQFGDLFASLLKRVAHVKDSGRLMPGHGGVLDRLDGVYFAGPIVYLWTFF